ncbi:hypothetical protein ACIQKB_37595 [Streptomyces sp. NPDC092046]|uniref:DinB/UmuC family translesion DNA polymerase n=1 Tax=Streptomyces sp. NPDC092046 TaxID=3366009 RepID=UPI003827809D
MGRSPTRRIPAGIRRCRARSARAPTARAGPTGLAPVRAALRDLAVTLAGRVRGREQIAHRIMLSVRFADGSAVERTNALPQPSACTDDLRGSAFRLLDAMAFQRAWTRRIALIAEDLRPAVDGPGTQISLDRVREDRLLLEPVLDRISAKFGRRLAGPVGAYLKAS